MRWLLKIWWALSDKLFGCSHDWRANDIQRLETFPVCRRCGRSCWYILGYMTNLGTYLHGNAQAFRVWDRTLFDANPTLRESHEYWSRHGPDGEPLFRD